MDGHRCPARSSISSAPGTTTTASARSCSPARAGHSAQARTSATSRSASRPTARGEGESLARGGYNMTNLIRESKPTIAAINGYAVGVGLTMILPCDVRIASTNANLSIRFHQDGPDAGTRLHAPARAAGRASANATDMCLTGRMVPAEEAAPHGTGERRDRTGRPPCPTALAKAEEIANNSTPAVRMIKELLRKNPMEGRPERRHGTRRTARPDRPSGLPDHAEAVEAFLAKREPNFNQ